MVGDGRRERMTSMFQCYAVAFFEFCFDTRNRPAELVGVCGMNIDGGRWMDGYIFFSIPVELQRELIPVVLGSSPRHVTHTVVRELGSALQSPAHVSSSLAG